MFQHIVMCEVDYRKFVVWMIGFVATLITHTTRDYRQYNAIADLHTLQFTATHTLCMVLSFTSRIMATDC
jgi:hypothetical protein